MADQGLAEGDKGAVSIKKAMQEGGPSVNNSNIVLIRLPEKRDDFLEWGGLDETRWITIYRIHWWWL